MQEKTINGFPSDFIDPQLKQEKDFAISWAKGIWNDADKGYAGSLGSDVDRYIELRRRAEGRTPINDYKNQTIGDGNTAHLTLNWAVSDPIKQIVNEMVGGFINREYKPQCQAIDQNSITEVDEIRNQLLFKKQLAKKAKQIEQETGVKLLEDDDPEVFESQEEIDLHLQMNVKASSCLGMELILSDILNRNKKPEVIRKVYRDLVVLAKAGIRVYYDENNDIRWRYVDPVNLITSFTKDDDFSDIKYAGELITMTIDRLAEISDLTEEQLFDAAKSNASKFNNPEWDNSWGKAYYPTNFSDGRPYRSFKVKVLDAEYLSTDYANYQSTEKQNGRLFFDKKELGYTPSKYSKNKKEMSVLRKETVYKAKWVVNTDYVFDYGRKANQVYEMEDDQLKLNTQLGFIIFAPNIYDMENKSLVEQIVPYADEMNLIQLKIQNYIAQVPPPGAAIDIAGLQNTLKGLGDVATNAMDVLNIYNQLGKLFYSSVGEDGEFIRNQKPIQELTPNLNPVMQMLQAHEYYRQQIREVIGISAGRSPVTPDKEVAVEVEKMALHASHNSTRYLQHAFVDIFNRGLRLTSVMVQDSIAHLDKKEKYARIVGRTMADSMEVASKIPQSAFGISTYMTPDAKEQAYFEQNVQVSLQRGMIKASDAVMLREQAKVSIELAARQLAIKEEKYYQQELEKSTVASQTQAQAQAESAALIEQAKQQTIELEWNRKDNHLRLEYQLKLQESAQDHDEDMREQVLKGEQDKEEIQLASKLAQENDKKQSDKEESIAGSFPKLSGQRQPKIPQGGASKLRNVTP